MKVLSSPARIETTPPRALPPRAVPAQPVPTRALPRPITPESSDEELVRLREQVSRLKAEREALLWAVGHDELTGLPNRRLLRAQAPTLLRERAGAVVAMLDLNEFKPINDAFGHEIGDKVLCVVARRLAACEGIDLVARLGGDEFAAVITHPEPEGDGWWRPVVAAMARAVAEPMPVAGRVLRVSASIGVAPVPVNTPLDELLSRADLAMYRAKAAGLTEVVWDDGGPDRPDPAVLEFMIFPVGDDPASAPADTDPDEAETAAPATAGAGSYRPGDPVWVHRNGAWRPGVVESASGTAVLATYRCADGPGTLVDTMSAARVRARFDADAHLDRNHCYPGVAA